MKSFSGTQAAEIVGITYRRLDYWARTDLVRPSAADATGSGSRREYTYRDLLELKVIKKLLDAGIRLESIRDVFAYMREHVDTDISAAHLVINGSSVILCDGEELIDVLRHGQGVLNVLPMSGVRDEVARRFIAFAPAAQELDSEVAARSSKHEEDGGVASVVAV